MKTCFTSVLLYTISLVAFGQTDLPTDYLSKQFHAQRREALRQLLPANSVAVIFSYPERVFSKDVDYVFHQNPDMYYFSGYKEPDAVLFIFKEMQGANDSAYNELFFARQRDSLTEIWTGRRLGAEGVKKQLGFKHAYAGEQFKNLPLDFKKFSVIIYDRLPTDIGNDRSGFDLAGLINTFKEKAAIKDTDETLHATQQAVAKYMSIRSMPRWIHRLEEVSKTNEAFKNDPIIQQVIAKPDSATLESIKVKIRSQKNGNDIYNEFTDALRAVKTPEEMVLLRKSVKISCLAHSEVMRAVTPAMSEHEAEGIHLYIHKKYGAEDEGYGPIVGVGGNGCILHYEENSATRMNNQLLLMDVGCEYHGYSADITRTVPANGKFSPEQKAVYEIVYNAQEEIFKLCKEGNSFSDLEGKAEEIVGEGLLKLGIIADKKDTKIYYPHGCSHHLGLDVHDKGAYDALKENMVITVEPGIYIPAGSKCDKKWWNIAVRIEDDVRIGKQQVELLSTDAPRKWQDVEKMAAEKSKINEIPAQQL